MVTDEPRTWRKTREGVEYGSFHAWDPTERRIVNLKTTSLDEAKAKARKLAAGVAGATAKLTGGNETPSVTPESAPAAPVSYLRNWAGQPSAAAPPAPPPRPAEPPPKELSPGIALLADGIAATIMQGNLVALALTARLFEYKAPPPTDRERRELEKTWALGLKELMLLDGVKWWHLLLFQNGVILGRFIQDGERLPPPAAAGVRPVSAVP